jgi:hypothetical protein
MVSYIDKTIDSVSDYLFWVKETNTSEIECDNGESISLYNDYGYYRGQNKSNILHELSVLGIDSGTIFKGTEEKLKAIVAEEKWCFNRFILY